MDIEIVAMAGLAFVAAALVRLVHEREMDVLHGPYIEGRNMQPALWGLLQPIEPIVDRLRARLRGMIFLGSIAAS